MVPEPPAAPHTPSWGCPPWVAPSFPHAGISGKSQILFTVIFTARYLDLFTNSISLYNTCMKMICIVCSFTTTWLIYSKFKATYDGNHDTFRVFLVFLVNNTSLRWRASGPSWYTWSRW